MPKDLVTSDGAVAWSASHSAYGRIVSTYTDPDAHARYANNPVNSPFRLLGQVADEDAELCWTRFRCFDPETGTWMSTDPLEIEGGLKLYGFDGAPTDVVDPLGLAGDPHHQTPTIGTRISQKQLRHIEGRPEWEARGRGSYMKSTADAQKVLDAYHSGDATVLGTTNQGHVVVQYGGVTGYNNNPGAGFVDQPTNVFMIKGTSSPSVVTTNPNWSP